MHIGREKLTQLHLLFSQLCSVHNSISSLTPGAELPPVATEEKESDDEPYVPGPGSGDATSDYQVAWLMERQKYLLSLGRGDQHISEESKYLQPNLASVGGVPLGNWEMISPPATFADTHQMPTYARPPPRPFDPHPFWGGYQHGPSPPNSYHVYPYNGFPGPTFMPGFPQGSSDSSRHGAGPRSAPYPPGTDNYVAIPYGPPQQVRHSGIVRPYAPAPHSAAHPVRNVPGVGGPPYPLQPLHSSMMSPAKMPAPYGRPRTIVSARPRHHEGSHGISRLIECGAGCLN